MDNNDTNDNGNINFSGLTSSLVRQISRKLENNLDVAIAASDKNNITFAQATAIKPEVRYAKCINDNNRPAKHVGDWPTAGEWYPIKIVPSRTEGTFIVQILGFEGEAPFYNGFSVERFAFADYLFPVCLN